MLRVDVVERPDRQCGGEGQRDLRGHLDRRCEVGEQVAEIVDRHAASIQPRCRVCASEVAEENDPEGTHGTINVCALGANGDLGSVTTTSGLSWKVPGRAGDSPIVGAGQYCDNRIGAAGSTGRGEANIKVCGAFLVVESMRRGVSPSEACLEALERAVELTEDRLLDPNGRPRFGLSFYAVSKAGAYGSATMYEPTEEQKTHNGGTFAVADRDGARLESMAYLFKAAERP